MHPRAPRSADTRCPASTLPLRGATPGFYRPNDSLSWSRSGAPSATSTTPALSSTRTSQRATSLFRYCFKCSSSVPGSPDTLRAPPAATHLPCPRRNDGTDSRHSHDSGVRAWLRPSSRTMPSLSTSARTNALRCPSVCSVTGAANARRTACATGPIRFFQVRTRSRTVRFSTRCKRVRGATYTDKTPAGAGGHFGGLPGVEWRETNPQWKGGATATLAPPNRLPLRLDDAQIIYSQNERDVKIVLIRTTLFLPSRFLYGRSSGRP